MVLFSKYLERKMQQANITYIYENNTNSVIMKDKESGKTWQPLLQTGGKYKRGFWKIP